MKKMRERLMGPIGRKPTKPVADDEGNFPTQGVKLRPEEVEWRRALDRDQALVEGLEYFCKDLLHSVEHAYKMLVSFWEVVHAAGLSGMTTAEDPDLVAQLWALRAGMTTVTPGVTEQLRRLLSSLRGVQRRNRDLQAARLRKDATWVEKEHYDLKLSELLREREEREHQGKAHAPEQIKKLERNLAKHDAACEEYAKVSEVINAAMRAHKHDGGAGDAEQAYTGGDPELRRALQTLAHVTACGWFISSGAAVCKALSEAEAEIAKSKGRATARSSQKALPAQQLQLPSGMTESSFSIEEVFDPSAPLKEAWHADGALLPEDDVERQLSPPSNAGSPPAELALLTPSSPPTSPSYQGAADLAPALSPAGKPRDDGAAPLLG